MNDEIFYAMALTRLTNFNFQQALELYKAVGSAQRIYEHRNEIQDIIGDCSPRLIEALKDWNEPMKRAEVEWKYMHTDFLKPVLDGGRPIGIIVSSKRGIEMIRGRISEDTTIDELFGMYLMHLNPMFR